MRIRRNTCATICGIIAGTLALIAIAEGVAAESCGGSLVVGDIRRDTAFATTLAAESNNEAKAYRQRVQVVTGLEGCVAFWDFVNREPDGQQRFTAHVPPGATNDFPLDAGNYIKDFWGAGREATYADFPQMGRGPFGNAIRLVKETDPDFRPFLFVARTRLHDSPLDIKGAGKSVTVVVWAIRESGNHALAGIWHEGTDLKQTETTAVRKVQRGQRQYALFAGLNKEGSACGHVSENGASSFLNKYALHKCNSAALSPAVPADSPAEVLDAAWQCFAMTFDHERDELTGWLNGVSGDRWLENPKADNLISSAYNAWLQGHYARTPEKEPAADAAFPKDQYYNPPEDKPLSVQVLSEADSLDLHGKLVFHEVDHTTHVARDTVENGRKIPGGNTKLPNAFASRQVLRREFALTRAKRTALWWFDFLGGNYASPEMMAMVAELVRAQERLRDVPLRSVAEIAVFGDVPSMVHINARSSLADDLLVRPPDELARIGAPYDIYNFSDLDHKDLPWDRYKLCIFLNAFCVPDEKRAFLRSKVQRNGRTLLWVYAPNYIQTNGFSVEAISGITGIKVARRAGEGSAVTVRPEGSFARLGAAVRCGFTPGQKSGAQRDQTFDMRSKGLLETTPLFEVRDESAQTCGVYDSDQTHAVAAKTFAEYRSVYSAVGNWPAALYRELARSAGVHIYYEGNDPLYINSRLIGIHMQTDTTHCLVLPLRNNCRLEELLDGGEVRLENGVGQLPHEPGTTKLYLLADTELQPTNRPSLRPNGS